MQCDSIDCRYDYSDKSNSRKSPVSRWWSIDLFLDLFQGEFLAVGGQAGITDKNYTWERHCPPYHDCVHLF